MLQTHRNFIWKQSMNEWSIWISNKENLKGESFFLCAFHFQASTNALFQFQRRRNGCCAQLWLDLPERKGTKTRCNSLFFHCQCWLFQIMLNSFKLSRLPCTTLKPWNKAWALALKFLACSLPVGHQGSKWANIMSPLGCTVKTQLWSWDPQELTDLLSKSINYFDATTHSTLGLIYDLLCGQCTSKVFFFFCTRQPF